ncbi:hypothetical protein WJ438_37030 [Streptomyces sp. GD-15H]
MGDNDVADLLVWQPAEHGHPHGGKDLPGVVAQQSDAEDLVRPGVDDGLPGAGLVVQVLARGMAATGSRATFTSRPCARASVSVSPRRASAGVKKTVQSTARPLVTASPPARSARRMRKSFQEAWARRRGPGGVGQEAWVNELGRTRR